MAKNDTLLVIVIIAVAGFFLINSGVIDLGGNGNDGNSDNLAPSDLKTSVTLNTRDALATTDTNADVDYFVFKKSGEFYKSGSTSSGSDSFDVQYGGTYELVAYDDDDAGSDYYPEMIEFTANTGEGSVKTINMALNKESNVTISSARDPVDLDANISASAGSTVSWQVLFEVTNSNAATKNPIIVVDVNTTSTDDVSVKGYEETDCPSRLSTASNRKKYCFRKEAVIKSSDGIQTVDGSIQFDATNGPSTTNPNEGINVTILDEQAYLEPGYVTEGRSGLVIAAEDSSDSDVGAADSTTELIGFD